MDQATIDQLKRIAQEARHLAASDNVLVRVAGERICAIAADVLYEIEMDAPEVISLMPPARRDAVPERG